MTFFYLSQNEVFTYTITKMKSNSTLYNNILDKMTSLPREKKNKLLQMLICIMMKP